MKSRGMTKGGRSRPLRHAAGGFFQFRVRRGRVLEQFHDQAAVTFRQLVPLMLRNNGLRFAQRGTKDERGHVSLGEGEGAHDHGLISQPDPQSYSVVAIDGCRGIVFSSLHASKAAPFSRLFTYVPLARLKSFMIFAFRHSRGNEPLAIGVCAFGTLQGLRFGLVWSPGQPND